VDPIVTAANIIVSLQSLMTRQVDPNEPAVLTFGTIQGGTRDSIIGEEVVIRGNLGALNVELRDNLAQQVEKVSKGVAEAMGASCDVNCWLGYPTVVNHPQLTEFVKEVAGELLGEGMVVDLEPSLGGEDFSYFLEKVPGVMWKLGCWDKRRYKEPPSQHHSKFDLDEEALPVGAKLMANVAAAYLSSSGV